MKNYGFVKCAIATINSKLSNSKDSVNRMKELVKEADSKDVKVLVFPELSLTGYTCQDLFGFTQLMETSMDSLKDLVEFSKDYDVMFVIGAPINVSDTLYNCAVVIQGGKIKGVVPKQYLPNYSEFYEKRWFTPYIDEEITSINLFGEEIPFGNLIFNSNVGYKFGVEICEDLWSVIPPSSYLSLAGANIIANISSSNELVGKNEYRSELVKTQSSRTISGYLYVSTGFGESTSDLVFGGSGYAYENGKYLASLERYQLDDQMKIFDVDIEGITNERLANKTFSDSKRSLNKKYKEVIITQKDNHNKNYKLDRNVNSHPFVPTLDNDKRSKVCKEIISIQAMGLARRLSAVNTDKVTIGISGGLDSTLALLVAYDAFKKLNLDVKGIIGVTMPGFGTTSRTYNNAINLCKELGITLLEIPIKDACIQHFKDISHDPEIHDVTYENVQARERTEILMNLANKYQGLVVGTGDLSELVLGWCTYNGDHMSMYGVNCSIPKTLVRYLIEWYANDCGEESLRNTLLDIIGTPISPELLPTDGKKVVQKTESTVGPYEVIDFFIYNFLRKRYSKDKTLYLANIAFKDKYTKEELEKYYDDFITRFFRNQFKRNCVPDGPKVGTVSVSPRGDLRMPSDADKSNWQLSKNLK
jgi:NAD+ synthase (glutamine-hydrolysing)